MIAGLGRWHVDHPVAYSASAETADPRPHSALRTRIAWLCHLTRAAALGWAAWVLIAMLRVWADPDKTAGMLGRYLNADLGAVSSSQVACGFVAQVAAWIPMAAVAYCIWRLFGGYRRAGLSG
jgi:hypothetical protein